MKGWAGGGADGFLIKTEDGGENWVVAEHGEHPIRSSRFLDPLNGYRIEWYRQTYPYTVMEAIHGNLPDVLEERDYIKTGVLLTLLQDGLHGIICWMDM